MLTLIFLFDFNIFARRQLREKKIFYNIEILNTYVFRISMLYEATLKLNRITITYML